MKTISNINKKMRSLGLALLLGLTTLSSAAAVNSGDASLNRLDIKVSGSNIVDGFSSSVTAYDVTLENLPATATLSAAPVASDATVDFTVNGAAFTNHSVASLTEGANTITCKVVSGNATKTYTVKVGPRIIDTGRTVHFKGGWNNQPYVYVYSGGTSVTEHAGAWPGTQMTSDSNGWYTYRLPDAADKNTLIIFNTGNGGSERYPAEGEAGIALDFDGNHGWYLLSDKKWYSSNPEGPQKPSITVSPASGKVKGSTVITIDIANDATSVSGTFNGRSLSLHNGSNSITVSDYLADGATATMTVSASNAIGTTDFSTSFSRDDTVIVSGLTGDWRELSI